MIQQNTTTNTVTLAQLQTKVGSGPIFIGESHANSFAREAIKELITMGSVTKLFFELPNIENDHSMQDIAIYLGSVNRTRDEGMEEMIVTIFNDMENMTGRKNSSRLGTLMKCALDKGGISIHFHDSPVVFIEAKKYVVINGKQKTEGYAGTIEGVKKRNIDSQAIISHHGVGVGTVILAGQAHLDPQNMGDQGTLQALLQYGNDTAFDLSNLTEKLK